MTLLALENWPERAFAVPPRISSGSIPGITAEKLRKDNQPWKERVYHYKRIVPISKGRYRNVMDMNAYLGGFAAALSKYPVWVMNTVLANLNQDTLGMIYERGFIGTYQDWCEAFSTYPRTYDLIHAGGVFSIYQDRTLILLEMDRILRLEGTVVFRDTVEILVKIKAITNGMRGSVMPLMLKFVPKCPSRAKCGSLLERLATMKSDKVDSATKVAPRPTPFAAETARVGSYEKSTKPASREATEIFALFKLNLLEDMNACAKFVDDVRKIVCPSSFVKHTAEYMKTDLLAMMEKMAILAAESMSLNQEDTKVAKEVVKAVAAKAYSSTKKIKRLESEFDELQRICVGMLEENRQLKGEKAGLKAPVIQSQANFYKLGYVDHLFGRPPDFEFVGRDFETFSISTEDLLAFTFEASINEVVEKVDLQAGVARGETSDNPSAGSVAAVEGVAAK
ncbi:methyltransferase PMT18 [Pyrus ussuriensis x Pyrus communis]|uniref:Methyltransferase n=1 Tax=Pyrus ussuriensis x Pyrus communis TaxID=2448454 RepID=A0A5N5G0S5_9ROSA|nr:methyltransferase PMT18 [Pyrus ussuriensis x Pyrus communis]